MAGFDVIDIVLYMAVIIFVSVVVSTVIKAILIAI